MGANGQEILCGGPCEINHEDTKAPPPLKLRSGQSTKKRPAAICKKEWAKGRWSERAKKNVSGFRVSLACGASGLGGGGCCEEQKKILADLRRLAQIGA